jgi:AcrR family transcriptional regulator
MPMRDSPRKRAEIVQAAMRVFAVYGYGRATFVLVHGASGKSTGSINNFFSDKVGLAAAVYADAANSLTGDIEVALRRSGTEVEAAIRDVLSACLKWESRAPDAPRALALLNGVISTSERYRELEFSTRVTPLLAEWAKPLIAAGRIAPLSPGQIYSIVLGPVMSAMALPRAIRTDPEDGVADWLHTLVGSAVYALTELHLKAEQHSEKSSTATRRRPSSTSKVATGQGTLFGQ